MKDFVQLIVVLFVIDVVKAYPISNDNISSSAVVYDEPIAVVQDDLISLESIAEDSIRDKRDGRYGE